MVKEKHKTEECVFCKIARGEIPATFIYSDDNFVVFNDVNPVSEGHCLIVPKKHYETLLDLPNTLGTELLMLAKAQSLRLIKEGKADGIKIVNNNYPSAGQVVKHFHMHVIPHLTGKKTGHV